MNFQLTSAARARMHEYLQRDSDAIGVRFGARRTGCSGFAYVVDIASEVGSDDSVFEDDGLRIVVDRKWLPFIDGTEIDYAKQGINAAFVFRNPNATGGCGCGESFTVEPEALKS